jgi:subtilisin-like proprotein convertase family protein
MFARLKRYCLLLLALACAPAHGAVFTTEVVLNTAIPDGNASGISSSTSFSALPNQILDVNVTLNITGGYNGDLYAWLRHGDITIVLLNRVGTPGNFGTGYGDKGFLVTLDDQATQGVNIHWYQTVDYSLNGSGQLTGTWRPDGGTLSSFNSMDPNGTWTIFFSDMSSGGQSTLVSWGLEITAVPEPIHWALMIFGGLFVVARVARRFIPVEKPREKNQ